MVRGKKTVEKPVPAPVADSTNGHGSSSESDTETTLPKKAPVPPKKMFTKKKISKKNSPSEVIKKRKKKTAGSYARYIYRVLRQIHPKAGITSKAMNIMNCFMIDIFERVSAEAARLVHKNKTKTLSSRDIQTATKLVVPGELGQHAVVEGTKAVKKYLGSK